MGQKAYRERLFCWLPEEVFTWLDALDLSRLADGPGGDARLATFRKMRAAHVEFPRGTVVADVRRRDYRSKAARQVYVKLDDTAKCGFVLCDPCWSFDWKREPSWSMLVEVGVGSRGPVAEYRGGRRAPWSRRVLRRLSGMLAVAPARQPCPQWRVGLVASSLCGHPSFRSGPVALLGSDQAA